MFYFIAECLKKLLAKTCRPIYCILFGRSQDGARFTRLIGSYCCGIFFALVLWRLLVATQFLGSENLELFALAALMFALGIGFVFSTGVKCITLLIFVAILGRSGRSYMRALSFAFIISGPIENLATNGEEVVRVFTCSAILTYNLTKTRLDLMSKPFQTTLAHMKNDIHEIEQTFAEVKNVLAPLRAEIEEDDKEQVGATSTTNKPNSTKNDEELISKIFYTDERRLIDEKDYKDDKLATNDHNSITRDNNNRSFAEPKEIQRKYEQKFFKRCVLQLEEGKQRCRKMFAKSFRKCQDKFPLIVRSFLCWPFRADFICKINILGDPDKICNPVDAIPDDFGETYADLNNIEHSFFNNSELKVDYKIQNVSTLPELINTQKTAEMIVFEFAKKKRIFNRIMNIMQGFLSFLFIRIICASFAYHRNFKRDIEYDNQYITAYFKHVDGRRKLSGKKHILPLKKYEKAYLINLSNICSKTKEESKAEMFHFIQFSLEVITAALFFLLDHVLVSLLRIVRLRSEISYVQEGEHTITFQIEGAGLMARLLRSTLRNFNMHERVSTYTSNEVCLPRPNALPQSVYIHILILYACILFLICKGTMFFRLRRSICSYFYRKREKARILHLYNSILQKRRDQTKSLLKTSEANTVKLRMRGRINLILRMRLRWPHICDWLKCFKVARRRCLICNSFEDDSFISCYQTNCNELYCIECWQDVGCVCLLCNARLENNRSSI